jgi:hypothetical protein
VPAAIALAITLIVFAITAPKADAAATRAEYVAQVDPICLTAGKRSARALKGIKLPREERFESLDDKQAMRLFFSFLGKAIGRTNKAIGPMLAEIAPIPPAPGDERVVALWLQAVGDYKLFADRAVSASNRGKLNKFFYYLSKAGLVADQANYLFDDWGFRYCASSEDSDYYGSSARRPAAAAWLAPGNRLVAGADRAQRELAQR